MVSWLTHVFVFANVWTQTLLIGLFDLLLSLNNLRFLSCDFCSDNRIRHRTEIEVYDRSPRTKKWVNDAADWHLFSCTWRRERGKREVGGKSVDPLEWNHRDPDSEETSAVSQVKESIIKNSTLPISGATPVELILSNWYENDIYGANFSTGLLLGTYHCHFSLSTSHQSSC